MGSKRGIAAFVLLVLTLGACTAQTVPAPANGEPSGALYGQVKSTDGRAVTDAEVSLFQLTRDDKVRTGMAVFSLGLFCLSPGFCPTPVHAKLSSEGDYAFPKRVMKDTPDLALTALVRDDDNDRQNASTSLALPDGPDPQKAPDLVIWEPKVTVEKHGTKATVRWSTLEGAAHGPDLAYSVWVRPAEFGEAAQQVAGPTTRLEASFDLRTWEDQPSEVAILAGTKANVDGQEVELGYRTAGAELPLLDAPPSRGKPCLVDDQSGKLVPAKAPCPLTDGELDNHAEVLAPGECSIDAEGCQSPTHRRLCVDLEQPRNVSLIVFRTPFETRGGDTKVEVSADGKAFSTVGGGRDAQTVSVPVRPARDARFVCLRGSFSGALMREVSVW